MVTARSKLRKVLLLKCSLWLFHFIHVNQISLEPLNGFVPYWQRRRVWSLAWTSLNVNVKGQGHQGQKRTVHSRHPPASSDGIERIRCK